MRRRWRPLWRRSRSIGAWQANPEHYGKDLARTLNNLSGELWRIGRHEEALAAVEEAVELRREPAEGEPATHGADLSMVLNNLSIRLAEAGRREEALAAIEEAVELRRPLVEENPAAYGGDLAVALTNLAARLTEMSRPEEALAATSEAVDLCRSLAAVNPAAYKEDLAGALHNYAGLLASGFGSTVLPLGDETAEGRRRRALSAIEEAVEIWRPPRRGVPRHVRPGPGEGAQLPLDPAFRTRAGRGGDASDRGGG
jgi:tetratricopeptide (TPR) repeat protein